MAELREQQFSEGLGYDEGKSCLTYASIYTSKLAADYINYKF